MGPNMSMQARGPRLRRRRAGAIVTALVLAICTVGVQAREAATVHVRCAEHGELVHVQAHPPVHLPAGTHLVPIGRDAAAGGHEHCTFIGANHCVQVAAVVPACSVVSAIEPRPPAAGAEVSARATFRIAPKNSPPV
jgi:hypothetical protein